MKRLLLLLSLLVGISAIAHAQTRPAIIWVNADPSGSCQNGAPLQNNPLLGHLSECKAGTWQVIANGSAGASPAGCPGAGSVQLYLTAGSLGCDTAFIGDTVNHLFKIGGAPITPFAGLYVGPNENTLPAGIQGYTNANVLITSVAGSNQSALAIEASLPSSGVGLFLPLIMGNGSAGTEIDAYASANGQSFYANVTYLLANGFTPGALYGYNVNAASASGSATVVAYYSEDFAGSATNPYYSWFNSQGVRRVKEDSTFDSVGQAIEALYNPLFTKYTPGAANYERIVEQWESNVAVITTEKGGTGTLRSLQLGDAGVHILVTDLKTTGAATGKKTVCVDTSTGQLYASSTGTDCSN